MRIAVIAWGSLLWNKGNLQCSDFDTEGPWLPLEFSRVSRDRRLTLVIDPSTGTLCKTYFAISEYDNIINARVNLKLRETAPTTKLQLDDVVGAVWYDKNRKKWMGTEDDPQIRSGPNSIQFKIQCWLTEHNRLAEESVGGAVDPACAIFTEKLDGAIWTKLPRNLHGKFNVNDTEIGSETIDRCQFVNWAIQWAGSEQVNSEQFERLAEYIENAPLQTMTHLRAVLETHPGLFHEYRKHSMIARDFAVPMTQRTVSLNQANEILGQMNATSQRMEATLREQEEKRLEAEREAARIAHHDAMLKAAAEESQRLHARRKSSYAKGQEDWSWNPHKHRKIGFR